MCTVYIYYVYINTYLYYVLFQKPYLYVVNSHLNTIKVQNLAEVEQVTLCEGNMLIREFIISTMVKVWLMNIK